MLAVNIYRTRLHAAPKLLAILAWDDDKQKIVFLYGKRYARQMGKGRYLDKKTKKYISIKDGKNFIQRLPFSLTGSYVWAGQTYEK